MDIATYIGTASPVVERGWFYDYQSFIAGIIALVAALLAVFVSWRQLEAAKAQLAETKRQADRDRTGKLRAARASLPAALSLICDYAEQVGRGLDRAWPVDATLYPDDVDPLASYQISLVLPPFPVEALQALERVVELTDSDPVAERIESMLREAQVLGARTRELASGNELSVDQLGNYILQAGSLYARAESLFEYGRRQSEAPAIEPLWDRVFAALNIMLIFREEVLAMARRERDAGLPPGEADTRPVY